MYRAIFSNFLIEREDFQAWDSSHVNIARYIVLEFFDTHGSPAHSNQNLKSPV